MRLTTTILGLLLTAVVGGAGEPDRLSNCDECRSSFRLVSNGTQTVLTDQLRTAAQQLPAPTPDPPDRSELLDLLRTLQQPQQPTQPAPGRAELLSLLQSLQQPTPAPQPAPDRAELLALLRMLQQPTPQPAPVVDETALLRILQQLAAREVVVEQELPAIVQEHNYEIPAYLEEREVIAPPRRPVVDVRLRKPRNCLQKFLANFAAMFRDDPPCRVVCPDDCEHCF